MTYSFDKDWKLGGSRVRALQLDKGDSLPPLDFLRLLLRPIPGLPINSYIYTFYALSLYLAAVGLYLGMASNIGGPDNPRSHLGFGHMRRSTAYYVSQFVLTVLIQVDTILRLIGRHNTFKVSASNGTVNNAIINTVLTIETFLTLVPALRTWWVPSFLYVWTFRRIACDLFHVYMMERGGIRRHANVVGFNLAMTIFCIIITAVCGVQHVDGNHLTLFQCLWLIIVTMSTVGYGDIVPETPAGRVYIMCFIILAIAILPTQISGLVQSLEAARALGSYKRRAEHVVACMATNDVAGLKGFLLEYFADVRYGKPNLVLLMAEETTAEVTELLSKPQWESRITVVHGSALAPEDLDRAQTNRALACFILSERPSEAISPADVDARTILRAWAVHDYSPSLPLYTHIILPQNMRHVKRLPGMPFCADEMRFALLALSCSLHGLTTLITTLMHTSDGTTRTAEMTARIQAKEATKTKIMQQQESAVWEKHDHIVATKLAVDLWQVERDLRALQGLRAYAESSGSEMYSTVLQLSTKHINAYIGVPFHVAAYDALKFRICLVGVSPACRCKPVPSSNKHRCNPTADILCANEIILFPGPDYSFQLGDLVFYIAETSVQRMSFPDNLPTTSWVPAASPASSSYTPLAESELRLPTLNALDEPDAPVGAASMFHKAIPVGRHGAATPSLSNTDGALEDDVVIQYLPHDLLYFGYKPNLCFMRRVPLGNPEFLGLELKNVVSTLSGAIVVDIAMNPEGEVDPGGYLILQYLRANRFVPSGNNEPAIRPVVFVLADVPDAKFLAFIGLFPAVYFHVGSLNKLNDYLLRLAVEKSHCVMALRDERQACSAEEYLADSKIILMVAAAVELVPESKIIVELNHRNNIRFVLFDVFSVRHRIARDKTAEDDFTQRQAYASGMVFSSSMLNTFLFQCFSEDKKNVPQVLELLLGVNVHRDSAGLSQIIVDSVLLETLLAKGKADYDALCKHFLFSDDRATMGLPIGLYTTFDLSPASDRLLDGDDKEIEGFEATVAAASAPNNTKQEKRTKKAKVASAQGLLNDSKHVQETMARKKKLKTLGDTMSLVLTNPAADTPVKVGDAVFILKRPMPHLMPTAEQGAAATPAEFLVAHDPTSVAQFRTLAAMQRGSPSMSSIRRAKAAAAAAAVEDASQNLSTHKPPTRPPPPNSARAGSRSSSSSLLLPEIPPFQASSSNSKAFDAFVETRFAADPVTTSPAAVPTANATGAAVTVNLLDDDGDDVQDTAETMAGPTPTLPASTGSFA